MEILEETGTLSLSLMMLPRRYGFIFLIRSKDQFFHYFLQFHTMVEREIGKKLKCLRSDNGGEFTKNGIRHEKKVYSTPQHNGVAERVNRTIIERVRCMLNIEKLPKVF